MKILVRFLVLGLLAASCADDGGNRSESPVFGLPELVPAPAAVLAQCHRTADAVGYPVACPTRLPAGLAPTRASGSCSLTIIGPGGIGHCSRAWRAWVVGSSETNDQHLVINASPRPFVDPAKVVNGPAWYRGARVRPLGTMRINGWPVRAIYVPPETNEGSAFAHHVVIVWTVGRHTYAVGFHNVAGIQATLDLDTALVRATKLVAPQHPD